MKNPLLILILFFATTVSYAQKRAFTVYNNEKDNQSDMFIYFTSNAGIKKGTTERNGSTITLSGWENLK